MQSFNFLNQPDPSKVLLKFPHKLTSARLSWPSAMAVWKRPMLQLPASPAGPDVILAAGGLSPCCFTLGLSVFSGAQGCSCPSQIGSDRGWEEVRSCCRNADLSHLGEQQRLGPCVPSENIHL